MICFPLDPPLASTEIVGAIGDQFDSGDDITILIPETITDMHVETATRILTGQGYQVTFLHYFREPDKPTDGFAWRKGEYLVLA